MGFEQNAQTVRRGYEAFTRGDVEALMTLYTDDAVHIIPGASRVSGAHKGKENLVKLYEKFFELTGGTFRVDLVDITSDGGDRIISVHTASVEKDGETISQTEALLFTFVDGKMAEIQDFVADIALNDRIFA